MLPGQGVKERERRVAEWVAKTLPMTKPGAWGCAQARVKWSTEVEVHMRPGHHCVSLVGTRCEKQFNLSHHTWEDYRGTRFCKQDRNIVIKRRLNRVEEDASGLTFQEWTPDIDTSWSPVTMIVNLSE